MKTYFSTIALLIFLLSSCGMHMEKRHYNKGFHVTFNTNKNRTFKDKRKDNPKIEVAESIISQETEVQNESLITSKHFCTSHQGTLPYRLQ